jgi:Fe2+ or Zn2+ uptake regulation protein
VRDIELDTRGVGLTADVLDGFAVETVDVVFRGRCAACSSS